MGLVVKSQLSALDQTLFMTKLPLYVMAGFSEICKQSLSLVLCPLELKGKGIKFQVYQQVPT